MSTAETAVAVVEPPRSTIQIGSSGLILNDLDSLWRFSGYVSTSGLAPKGIQSREAIFTAIQMGLEVGLTPMAALQNIAVINGRPSIWGDAQLSIVRGTGQVEMFEEWFEQGGKRLPRNPVTYTDDTAAVCRVKRRGYEPNEVSFSVADAKTAGLWGKDGPWRQYPFRMLRFRARSFALRDQFGDALKGILSAEEVRDIVIEVEPAKSVAASVASTAVRERKPRVIEAAQPAGTAAPDSEAVKPSESVFEAPTEGVLQNRLAAFVAGEGCTFDDFIGCARNVGFLDGADLDAGAFIELSDKAADKCLKAQSGLRGLLAQAKGGAK